MNDSNIQHIRGACPHDCPDTCATITEVQDGRAIRFYADKTHPITNGWLCAKVRPYLERVYAPDRLQYPLLRRGAKGSNNWQRISWDEAIDTITTRWKNVIAEYGASAILPYSYSGTLGLVQLAVCNTRLWNRMGASGLRRAICSAAAHMAVKTTLGARWAPDPADMLHSRLVIIWGHNPASTSPHTMPFLRQAQKQGAYVVVIDPRRTRTARCADEHIQPLPATDGALALGLMYVIFEESLHNEQWLETHTVGWRDLRERARAFPPQRVAAITGIPAEQLINLARRFATTTPAMIKIADGLQRHANGGQIVRSVCCLPALTGQYGVQGGGLFYNTGDNFRWNTETIGHGSSCPPVPRIVNMNRLGAAITGETDNPPILSLFIFCANPVAASPNAGLIVRGLQREDLFTVVHDLFMTDTARYADIVLPATSQLEHWDLHAAYGHRYLSLNCPAIPPLGDAKSNWDVMRLLARGMGYEETWLQQSAEDVIRELLDTARAEHPGFANVTFEHLLSTGSIAIPCPSGQKVPFANGVFPTTCGKVLLRADSLATQGLDPLPDYVPPIEFVQPEPVDGQRSEDGLILLSGAAHHFVTSSFANQASLMQKEGPPIVEINPQDAAVRGITHGMLVSVENRRGSCQLKAVVTDNVPVGVTAAPKGVWPSHSPGGQNINWTTPDALADFAGQSTFHSNIVWIRPLE